MENIDNKKKAIKKYYEKNKDKINEKAKEKAKTKVLCHFCQKEVSYSYYPTHRKQKIHIENEKILKEQGSLKNKVIEQVKNMSEENLTHLPKLLEIINDLTKKD